MDLRLINNETFASDLQARLLLVVALLQKERKPVRLPHEPKRRHSKSVKNIRRAAIKLSAVNLVVCPNCNFKTLAHMACRNCGSYAGKKVADEAVKITRA